MRASSSIAQRVLLTGFSSFPGVPVNVTCELVPRLAHEATRRFPGNAFSFDILPVTWAGGPQSSARLVDENDPDLIVHFGVSDLAEGFVIETLARNVCRVSHDASGALPALELLDANAPVDIETTLPYWDILRRLEDEGLPACLSDDAGGYLCNAVLFHSLRRARAGVRAGFVHLPVSFDAPDDPLSMDDAIRGGLGILAVCLAGTPPG